MDKISEYPKQVLLKSILIYQWLCRPLVGNCCRFYPSCSQYAHTAITRHGIWRGSFLMVKRLLKCHPWHPGGVDEVP